MTGWVVQCILGYLNLDYPTTLRKPRGSWRLWNLAKWHFPIVKSNAKCWKCIDYQREARYLQVHGYIRSTTEVDIDYSWIILKENGQHRWISLTWTNSLIWTLLKFIMTKGIRITKDALYPLDQQKLSCLTYSVRLTLQWIKVWRHNHLLTLVLSRNSSRTCLLHKWKYKLSPVNVQQVKNGYWFPKYMQPQICKQTL